MPLNIESDSVNCFIKTVLFIARLKPQSSAPWSEIEKNLTLFDFKRSMLQTV